MSYEARLIVRLLKAVLRSRHPRHAIAVLAVAIEKGDHLKQADNVEIRIATIVPKRTKPLSWDIRRMRKIQPNEPS